MREVVIMHVLKTIQVLWVEVWLRLTSVWVRDIENWALLMLIILGIIDINV